MVQHLRRKTDKINVKQKIFGAAAWGCQSPQVVHLGENVPA